MKDLVTIIIPVYNSAPYLQDCAESLIHQTYPNLEIIFIDDGSTDQSFQILSEYRTKYPRLQIYQIRHGGIGDARNNGLAHAQGKYIFFIDSDDYLVKDTIEKVVKVMSTKQLEICIFNGVAFYHETRQEKSEKYFPIKKFRMLNNQIPPKLKGYLSFFHSACFKAYSHEFLRKNKIFFPTGIYGEDIEFWFRCLLKVRKVYYLDYTGYRRRIRKTSVMGEDSWKNTYDRINNIESLLSLCIKDKYLYSYLIRIHIPYLKAKVYHKKNPAYITYLENKIQ